MSTENKNFAMRTAAIAGTVAVIEWVSFKFLAITTAVMAGNVYHGYFINNGLPPALAYWMNIAAITITYFIIDHGLAELLKFVVRDKSERGTNQRKFVRIIILFVAIRILITATSSWWAAAEIADLTVKDDTHYFMDAKLAQDSSFAIRYQESHSEAETMKASESSRLEAAEIEGARMVREAVESGSIHQVRMWKSNPNFFRSLSPSSKYYGQNKAYADAVFAAQENAARLIEAEKDRTLVAVNGAQQLTVIGDSTSTRLGLIAEMRAKEIEAKRSRRKNMLWVMDIISTIFGIGAVIIRSRREDVVGDDGKDERSFSFMAGQAFAKWRKKMLDELEDMLNLDLNNDGRIGTGANVQHITSGSGANTSGATSVQMGAQARQPIGFKQNVKQRSETTKVKQPETTVKQYVAGETNKVKQPGETGETTTVKQENETVVLVNSNPRYLKQRCKQNYVRIFT